MALERQITFKTNVTKTIDTEIENYLRTNEIDPAAIQVAIDGGNGVKTATLTYGSREAIKSIYETQGRKYSNADAVTYCHVKDIVLPFTEDLDKEVNEFLSNDDVSALAISRYFTLVNQGALIFYICVSEQTKKAEEKQLEVEAEREELAQKLASQAVKEADLATNETIESYAGMAEQAPVEETPDTQEEHIEEISKEKAPDNAKSNKSVFGKRNR